MTLRVDAVFNTIKDKSYLGLQLIVLKLQTSITKVTNQRFISYTHLLYNIKSFSLQYTLPKGT